MQAPKDGDAWTGFEDLKALQGERKGLEDSWTCQDKGEPAETFVTRNCEARRQDAAMLMRDVANPCSSALPGAPDTVPIPQVLGWSGGGSKEGLYGRVTIGIHGREVAYVPEHTHGNDIKPEPVPAGLEAFDAWLRNPYTAVHTHHIARLQSAIGEVDGLLSHVLHELAGSASLCWNPKPAGEFDSEQALMFVEQAINRLRGILRDV